MRVLRLNLSSHKHSLGYSQGPKHSWHLTRARSLRRFTTYRCLSNHISTRVLAMYLLSTPASIHEAVARAYDSHHGLSQCSLHDRKVQFRTETNSQGARGLASVDSKVSILILMPIAILVVDRDEVRARAASADAAQLDPQPSPTNVRHEGSLVAPGLASATWENRYHFLP